MPAHTFAWDGASRLTKIDAGTIDETTLAYDGLGDVTTRSRGGTTTNYFYHHAITLHPLVAENSGGSMRYYVWTPRGTLLWCTEPAGAGPRFYHYDRIGSTLALTDRGGAITDTYAYTPYGERLGQTGTSTQPFTFAGAFGIRGEGAFYQMRARYYDPLTARFLSRDIAPPRLHDPRTLDPYLYALGNPTNYVDRDGAKGTKSTWPPADKGPDVSSLGGTTPEEARSIGRLVLYFAEKGEWKWEVQAAAASMWRELERDWDAEKFERMAEADPDWAASVNAAWERERLAWMNSTCNEVSREQICVSGDIQRDMLPSPDCTAQSFEICTAPSDEDLDKLNPYRGDRIWKIKPLILGPTGATKVSTSRKMLHQYEAAEGGDDSGKLHLDGSQSPSLTPSHP
jgi:RHS repeat-associated protein